jgi:pilus assembly protein CpaB
MQQPATAPAAIAAPEVVTETVREARVQILAARAAIGVGQRLTADVMEWVEWPEGAMRGEYITAEAMPEAIATMEGAVARFEFFAGEPIREQKLAQNGQGYLSAVLDSGKRGVSVMVAAAAASGGFIVPNDRVDVVLTRSINDSRLSETILNNVRVLAINSRLGESAMPEDAKEGADRKSEMFFDTAIATLELDPAQAEVIINASNSGNLSLVLRSMSDFSESAPTEERPTNQAIRISSPFWTN